MKMVKLMDMRAVAWEKNTVRICGGKSENWKRQALKKSSQNANTETEKKSN